MALNQEIRCKPTALRSNLPPVPQEDLKKLSTSILPKIRNTDPDRPISCELLQEVTSLIERYLVSSQARSKKGGLTIVSSKAADPENMKHLLELATIIAGRQECGELRQAILNGVRTGAIPIEHDVQGWINAVSSGRSPRETIMLLMTTSAKDTQQDIVQFLLSNPKASNTALLEAMVSSANPQLSSSLIGILSSEEIQNSACVERLLVGLASQGERKTRQQALAVLADRFPTSPTLGSAANIELLLAGHVPQATYSKLLAKNPELLANALRAVQPYTFTETFILGDDKRYKQLTALLLSANREAAIPLILREVLGEKRKWFQRSLIGLLERNVFETLGPGETVPGVMLKSLNGSNGIGSELIERYKLGKELGIDYPSRLTIDTLRTLFKDQHLTGKDSRPVAVVIYPKVDHNGGFHNDGHKIESLARNGYRVVYREVESDKQFVSTLLDATKGRKADVLIIGGHGSQSTIQFGGDKSRDGKAVGAAQAREREDRAVLDLNDETWLRSAGLGNALNQEGKIFLISCSTGKGLDQENNIANMLRRLFPHAAKNGIFAQRVSDDVFKFKYDAHGRIVNYELWKRNHEPYRAHGGGLASKKPPGIPG